jgi:hypothetical protein
MHAYSQQITYGGPIEYKYTRIKTVTGSGNEGYNWNVNIDEKHVVEGTFYVVFSGMFSSAGFTMYQMASVEEVIHFENSVNNEANEERTSQGCSDENSTSTRVVSPGDSRTYRQIVTHERINPMKPCINGGTLNITSPNSGGDKKLQSGSYTIMLGGEIETEMISETFSENKFACNPERNAPPDVISQTMKMSFPLSIIIAEEFNGADILEGKKVILDNHTTDCGPGSPYANMTHGEVDCNYIEDISVSWHLTKRNKECDASLTDIKGDVKINGVPVENGNVKIGAGDMITTGGKSGIKIHLPDNSYMALGSNSRLVLGDPCNLNPVESKVSMDTKLRMLAGKMFYLLGKSGDFELKTGTAGGVRGQINPSFFEPYFTNERKHGVPFPGFQDETVVNDPEKISLIRESGNFKDSKLALYIHSDAEGVHDISALKGNLEVESTDKSKKMVVNEGSTVTMWPDGHPFGEIIVRTTKDKSQYR